MQLHILDQKQLIIDEISENVKNSAASVLESLAKIPQLIVLPERLIPGRMATAWAQPIRKACFKLIFSQDTKFFVKVMITTMFGFPLQVCFIKKKL